MAAVIDLAHRGPATGFTDPVHDSQGVFRAVLQALSRPGRAQPLRAAMTPPAPLSPVVTAVALTILDQDVTAWLSPSLNGAAVRDYLTFHAGTRCVAGSRNAAFVLCASPAEIPELATLAQGTPAYPDRSATVIVDVSECETGESVSITLSGPGIEHSLKTSIPGFSRDLWRQLQANHAAYPLGVDVIVCLPDALLGLPRSTRIEVA